MKRDNLTIVVTKLALELHAHLDIQKVYDELLIHPDYPSLLAISDVLQNFGIDNIAYRIDKDKLANVPCPFIVHTNINPGDFLLVHKIKNGKATVSGERWNRYKINLPEFTAQFDGVVLSAEVVAKTSSSIFSFNQAKFKTPFAVGALLLALFAAIAFHTSYFANLSWQVVLLTFAKTAGLITSVLLLIQAIDTNNPLVQKLCQGGGKTNCNDILSSKAAKVFEGLSWSEVGFFYFASTWLFLLFGTGSVPDMKVLALLNIISLPYTFYSIYYQARVAKTWCLLCCTVQALLWLEFLPLFSYFQSPFAWPAVSQISMLFIALILPVALWLLLKPMLLQLQQVHPLKVQLQKFKYNADLFNKTLAEQSKYTQPDEEWSIVLGNVEAENVITMVTNPYCPPCAKTHKLLHELLEQRKNLQARIVFTARNTDNDIKTPVSRHLMTLHGLPDKTVVIQALYDWYEQKQKNYDTWAKAYPVQLNKAEYNKIDKQKTWCELAEITVTPTMLLNGYKLPAAYQLTDLKYILQ